MPHAAPTPCKHTGCPRLVYAGAYCEDHAGERPKSKRVHGYNARYGRRWQKIAKAVRYDEPFCRLCGKLSTCVDHIKPIEDGGTNARGNLQALCWRCHSKKTRKENAGARGGG